MERVLSARWTLPDPGTCLDGGGVLLSGGLIARVLRSRAAVRRAARRAPHVDLGDCALAPGLVNAHAHLELSGLRGRLPRDGDFARWVGELVRLRAARPAAQLARDARAGAERCLETGTTALGDLDATGSAAVALAGHPLRLTLYREVLDAQDPARAAEALARLRRRLPPRSRVREGVAPHAPHTVSPALLAASGRIARRRGAPLSVHWAETPAEVEWLLRGSGPFAPLLGPSPRRSGLDLLERAGLLAGGLALSLVHGNHPSRGDMERVAKSGAVLVHCPGSHAFFARAPFPLRRWLASGATLALGTDSLASNDDLDLRREMRLLREGAPWIDPRRVWAMATEGGARALGLEGRIGVLAPGAWADLAAHAVLARGPGELLDLLTAGQGQVRSVWIGGRAVQGSKHRRIGTREAMEDGRAR